VWAHAPLCGRLPLADDVAGFVCAYIEGVHTLTLRLIKEKIRGNLRPYPSTLGWARRIGRVFGLTSRIDIDYIFDLANRRGRDVFFLQVGANDGLMDDPIHFLIRKPLQHDQASRLNRIQATSTRGVRACIRRVAGCATPTGSAGHAGATANLKLTFQPDHSAGADQS
jgi:hypothetical protein